MMSEQKFLVFSRDGIHYMTKREMIEKRNDVLRNYPDFPKPKDIDVFDISVDVDTFLDLMNGAIPVFFIEDKDMKVYNSIADPDTIKYLSEHDRAKDIRIRKWVTWVNPIITANRRIRSVRFNCEGKSIVYECKHNDGYYFSFDEGDDEYFAPYNTPYPKKITAQYMEVFDECCRKHIEEGIMDNADLEPWIYYYFVLGNIIEKNI